MTGAELKAQYAAGRRDFAGANLAWANLTGAYLAGANLPPPTVLWQAAWDHLSPRLCLEAMRWDALFHPDPQAFDTWKETGKCPYSSLLWTRAVNFQEDSRYWEPGPPTMTPMAFTKALFRYKKIKRGRE